MIRRPPNSTLLPHTTLVRSLVEADAQRGNLGFCDQSRLIFRQPVLRAGSETTQSIELRVKTRRDYAAVAKMRRRVRSEEHTSELQLRQYLVCRLLLEKKK